MERIPFEVAAILGRGTLPQDSFLSLAEGDVLVLDQSLSDPLSFEISGVPQGRCRIGKAGPYKSMRIVEER